MSGKYLISHYLNLLFGKGFSCSLCVFVFASFCICLLFFGFCFHYL
jgi:hypothetical protein